MLETFKGSTWFLAVLVQHLKLDWPSPHFRIFLVGVLKLTSHALTIHFIHPPSPPGKQHQAGKQKSALIFIDNDSELQDVEQFWTAWLAQN